MPFQDMYNNHVPQVDQDSANTLMDQLEALLQPFLRNLTPEENATIGSISETNKLFVNKVGDYHQNQPALDSPDVDWPEFEADYQSRRFYELLSIRIDAMSKSMKETRRLHDHDNFQNGLIDYEHAKYKDRTSTGMGYDTKVEELSQFFTGGGASEPTPDNP